MCVFIAFTVFVSFYLCFSQDLSGMRTNHIIALHFNPYEDNYNLVSVEIRESSGPQSVTNVLLPRAFYGPLHHEVASFHILRPFHPRIDQVHYVAFNTRHSHDDWNVPLLELNEDSSLKGFFLLLLFDSNANHFISFDALHTLFTIRLLIHHPLDTLFPSMYNVSPTLSF